MTIIFRGKDAGDYRFISARNGLTGWIRKDLPEEFFAELVRDPDGLMDRGSSQTVKDGLKTKVVRHILQDGKGIQLNVITKRFHYSSTLRRLGFFFFPSPAVRCLKAARLLKSKGILTSRPLAALEYRNWRSLGTSYYITEEVEDSHSLQSFWQTVLPKLATKKRLAITRSILRDLARLLAGLHSKGIYHRDLKGSNILVQAWETDRRRFFLVDLDRVAQRALVSRAKRIKNLLQVRRGAWSRKERSYFFMRYAMLSYPSKKDAKEFVRKVLAALRRRKSGRKKFKSAGSR
jgi:serine/threonine protein kinase